MANPHMHTSQPFRADAARGFTLLEVLVVVAMVGVVATVAVVGMSRTTSAVAGSPKAQQLYDDVARHRAALLLANVGPTGCLQLSSVAAVPPATGFMTDYDLRTDCTLAASSIEHVTIDHGAYLDLGGATVCFDAQARPVDCAAPATLHGDTNMPLMVDGAVSALGDLIWQADSHLETTFPVNKSGDAVVVAHLTDVSRTSTPNPTPGSTPPAGTAVNPSGLLR